MLSLFAFDTSKTGSPYFTELGVNLFPDVDDNPSEVQCSNLEQPVLHEEASVPVDFINTSSSLVVSSGDCSTSSTTINDCSTLSASSTTSPVRCSSRVSHPPNCLQDYQCYSVVATIHEPQTFKDA